MNQQSLRTKSLEVSEIVMRCRCGAQIGDCIREAAIIAITIDAPVSFTHNETQHVVKNEIVFSTK